MKYHNEIARRKTFAIISHPDAGKTTLTEKFLLFGGAIQTAGAVKSNKIKKHATQISGEGEKERRVLFEKLFSKMEKSRIEIDSLLNYIYN